MTDFKTFPLRLEEKVPTTKTLFFYLFFFFLWFLYVLHLFSLLFIFSVVLLLIRLRNNLPVVVQHGQSSEAPVGLSIPEQHPSRTCELPWQPPGVLEGSLQLTMCLLKLKCKDFMLDFMPYKGLASTTLLRLAWLSLAKNITISPEPSFFL